MLNSLPSGLVFHRADGVDRIESADDFTFQPSRPHFGPVLAGANVGGDVSLTIFGTALQADAFVEGFEHAVPGDDASWRTESVVLDGRTAHLVLIHWDESSDDSLRVRDLRKSPGTA